MARAPKAPLPPLPWKNTTAPGAEAAGASARAWLAQLGQEAMPNSRGNETLRGRLLARKVLEAAATAPVHMQAVPRKLSAGAFRALRAEDNEDGFRGLACVEPGQLSGRKPIVVSLAQPMP